MLKNALKEYAGNEWAATTLKSKAWKDDNGDATPSISATCKIDAIWFCRSYICSCQCEKYIERKKLTKLIE